MPNETKRIGEVDAMTRALEQRIKEEEARFSRGEQGKAQGEGSLWRHLERVALLSEKLGQSERLDPFTCRLAGLFHDAGKFSGGSYHRDDKPEEERSVEVLLELAGRHGLNREVVDQSADSIRQLYRDDPDPTPLTRVLFDADNLDKLGPLGVANYFIKVGLRGNGMSKDLLYRLTVELTYARHAPACMATLAGRELALRKAPQTYRFLLNLLQSLRDDGLYNFRVEEVIFEELVLDVVAPAACDCGGTLKRRVWKVQGMKCIEIHLDHSCASCGARHELRFCSPKLGLPFTHK